MLSSEASGPSRKESGILALLFTSRIEIAAPWDRWDRLSLVFALAMTALVFAFKMKTFLWLAYTSDLFNNVQLARAWMEGRILEDNCYGHHLSIHTFFFLLPLGLLARPLGAPGLLLAVALSAGASCLLSCRILRLLGVAGPVAAGAGLLLVLAPFAVGNYHDKIYGFHVELLLPAMALGLVYVLLQRKLVAAFSVALAMVSVKEEVPVLVALISAFVLVEDFCARRAVNAPHSRRMNGSAVAVMLLAAAALPVLLYIINSNPSQGYAPNSFSRLALTRDAPVSNGLSLVSFVLSHVGDWLRSTTVASWLRYIGLATFGLVLMRPHGLLFALPLTVVAWLMNDSIIWAPRFAPSLAFAWCLSLFGLASLWRFLAAAPWPFAPLRRAALVSCCAVACASFVLAIDRAPGAFEVYTFSPQTVYSRIEREQADRLFAKYRKEATSEEPTAASPYLFRYVHDRNLYWLDRLQGRPRPQWILTDHTFSSYERYGLAAGDYEVIDRLGPFALHLAKRSR